MHDPILVTGTVCVNDDLGIFSMRVFPHLLALNCN